MNYQRELGIQSYCFRGFKDNAKVATLLKSCGVNVLELCAVHVDFNDERKSAAVLETYQNHGVRITAIGVEGFRNNPAAERKRFEFAKRAGAKTISATFAIDSVPKSYRTAERLADKYDINLGIHNHGGYDWLGSRTALRHVFKNTSKRIGLCLDTAWALQAGEDPVAMAEEFGERLYGVHIKDFIFNRAGKHKDVVVGTGNLDLKKLIAVLKKAKFNGSFIIEYEGDVNNPVPALKKCVAVVRKVC
jgi:sugar phosphate isomerase/epimerase